MRSKCPSIFLELGSPAASERARPLPPGGDASSVNSRATMTTSCSARPIPNVSAAVVTGTTEIRWSTLKGEERPEAPFIGTVAVVHLCRNATVQPCWLCWWVNLGHLFLFPFGTLHTAPIARAGAECTIYNRAGMKYQETESWGQSVVA